MLMTSSEIGGFSINLCIGARSREQVVIPLTVINYSVLSENLKSLKENVWATVVWSSFSVCCKLLRSLKPAEIQFYLSLEITRHGAAKQFVQPATTIQQQPCNISKSWNHKCIKNPPPHLDCVNVNVWFWLIFWLIFTSPLNKRLAKYLPWWNSIGQPHTNSHLNLQFKSSPYTTALVMGQENKCTLVETCRDSAQFLFTS